MYVNALAALLFIVPALANPVGSTSADSWSDSSDSDLSDYADSLVVPSVSVPNSILTVLATAIPVSWYEDLLDPSSRSSIMSEIQAGTLPAWYSALPSSVKAWASAQGGVDENLLSLTETGSSSSEATGAPQATVTATPLSETITNTASATKASGATASNTASSSGVQSSSGAHSTAQISSESSTQASFSSSVSPSSSTSTGGAPVPTAGVAIGLASVAGLLGLAIAL